MHSINLSVSSNAEAAVIDIFSSSLFHIALSTHFPLCTLFMTAAAAAAFKKFASKNKRRQPDPVRLENLGRLWKVNKMGPCRVVLAFYTHFAFYAFLCIPFVMREHSTGSLYTHERVCVLCAPSDCV